MISATKFITDHIVLDVRHDVFLCYMSWKARVHLTVLDLRRDCRHWNKVLRCHRTQLNPRDNVWFHLCEPQLISNLHPRRAFKI